MRASRLWGALLWSALGFSSALLIACDDTTDDPGAPAGQGDARGPSQAVDPDAASPVLGDASLPADQGAPPPADGGAPGDAAPRPECADDEACGAGRVCHDDRCIEGTRCEADRGCPAGRICVADICLADPRSTGGLIAEPDVLVFSFSEVGETSIRGARAENRGDDTVVITAIEAAPAAFQVLEAPALPLRLVPGQGVDLTVQYTADDAVDDEGALSLRTDRAAAEPVQVRLTSQHKVVGGQDPCLQVAPNRLDFGGVTRGDTATRTFELVSCGDVPVRINAIRRGVSFFGALPDTYQLQQPPAFPLDLAPGQRHTITVAYSPRRAGIEGGFWDVHSTDATNPQQRVDVSALATPPPLDQVGLHVRLAWDTDLTDVDLHLVGPGGQLWTCAGDCYFSNPNPNWSDPMEFRDDPFLDVDDVDGFGPENINLEAPAPGTYRVVVQYWADHAGDVPDATVELLEFGNVIASYGPGRMGRVNDVWEVVDIQYPGPVLTPLGANVVNQNRGALCGGF